MDGTSAASNPNPGATAEPHVPPNTEPPPKTIFWDYGTFGMIKRDVHAIFTGGLNMWSDPKPSSATTGRTDLQANLDMLGKFKHEPHVE